MRCVALYVVTVWLAHVASLARSQSLPIIVTTWETTHNATLEAWDRLTNQQEDLMDAIVGGCSVCEIQKGCGASVGPGDKPSESGEVTQDAMIMDGRTMDVGSVGCLRRVVNAIGVAQAVLRYTTHTLLVGELATDFAIEMGFPEESLSSNRSNEDYQEWQDGNCQPNFWENVTPDPTTSCGPYTPIDSASVRLEIPEPGHQGRPNHSRHPEPTAHGPMKAQKVATSQGSSEEPDHDTIGLIAVDALGDPGTGVTTNGLSHKIAGRVGDSPIPGAGSFAEGGIGAAAATGNGDIILRMLPTNHIVQLMGEGLSPTEAATAAMSRIAQYYPQATVAVTAVNVAGEFGAACTGYTDFPYHYINPTSGGIVDDIVTCI